MEFYFIDSTSQQNLLREHTLCFVELREHTLCFVEFCFCQVRMRAIIKTPKMTHAAPA